MAPEVRIHAPPLSWKEGSNAPPDATAPVQYYAKTYGKDSEYENWRTEWPGAPPGLKRW